MEKLAGTLEAEFARAGVEGRRDLLWIREWSPDLDLHMKLIQIPLTVKFPPGL